MQVVERVTGQARQEPVPQSEPHAPYATQRSPAWSRRTWVVAWCLGNVVFGALIALPDPDERLFSISGLHGPGPLDAVGAVGLILLWAPVIWVGWRRLLRRRGPLRIAVCVVAAVLLLSLAATIVGDLGWWWLPPAVALGVLQASLFVGLSGPPRA